MHQMHRLHTQFFRALKEQATLLHFEGNDEDTAKEFLCFCNRAFTTPQGLATHKRLAHGIGAQEKHFIDGALAA